MPVEIGTLRILAGVALVLMLLWWTFDRLVRSDSDDPSFHFGGDWVLFRASGIAAIALVVIIAAALLWPVMSPQAAAVLTMVVGYWMVSEYEEGD